MEGFVSIELIRYGSFSKMEYKIVGEVNNSKVNSFEKVAWESP